MVLLKEVELKLIIELMKNSHRSDREISSVIGVSQPTVSRIRSKLEKEGMIKEYTMIPDFTRLGITLLAVTLVKYKGQVSPEGREKALALIKEKADSASTPEAVIIERGMGMNYDSVVISLLKDYADYTRLIERIRRYEHVQPSQLETFIVNLQDKVHIRSLTFSTFPKYLMGLQKKEKK